MEQTTPNPKCTSCHRYWTSDKTDIKSSGLMYKTCKNCRELSKISQEKNKCEHGRRKNQCKDCGGSSICEHRKEKYYCIDCGGYGICKHRKQKSLCIECGGGTICEHRRIKCRCKECNFTLYLVKLQRNQLRRLFKKTDVVKKTKPSIEYLGCSSDYFINYIEKQFEEGMNWNNIHLDHIKPVSKFNLDDEEEFLQCCNYKNFQPLLAKDNLEKSNKFTKDDEEEWIKRMEDLTL